MAAIVVLCVQMAKIPIGGKKGEGLFMTVDFDQEAFFRSSSWTLCYGGYLQSRIDGKFVLAHRMVFRGTPFFDKLGEVHHKNGDCLDNRRCNLFPIMRGSVFGRSLQNRVTKKAGVSFNKRDKVWRVNCRGLNGERVYRAHKRKEVALSLYDSISKPIIKILEENCTMEWEDINIV